MPEISFSRNLDWFLPNIGLKNIVLLSHSLSWRKGKETYNKSVSLHNVRISWITGKVQCRVVSVANVCQMLPLSLVILSEANTSSFTWILIASMSSVITSHLAKMTWSRRRSGRKHVGLCTRGFPTKISGLVRCEGSDKGERVGAGSGNRLSCLCCCSCLYPCLHCRCLSCSKKLHWLFCTEPTWAELEKSWLASKECREALENVFGEQISSQVAVLQLLWQNLSDDGVIFTHLYFFQIGFLYTVLGWVRVWQQVPPIGLVWEFGETLSACGGGLVCCSYVTNGHRHLGGGAGCWGL